MSTVPIQRAHGVSVQPSLMVDPSASIEVSWKPDDIFPASDDVNSFSVDIYVYVYDFNKAKWIRIHKQPNLPNSGQTSLTLLSLPTDLRNILSSAIIHVTVGMVNSTSMNKDLIERIQIPMIPFPHRIGIWSGLLFATGARQIFGRIPFRIQCHTWHQNCKNRQDDINLKEVLPPCPPTLDRAQLPNSGLEEMRFNSLLFSSNYHSLLMKLFHPGVSKCFVQPIVSRFVVISEFLRCSVTRYNYSLAC